MITGTVYLLEILVLYVFHSLSGSVYVSDGIIWPFIITETIALYFDIHRLKLSSELKSIMILSYFVKVFLLFSDLYLEGIINVFGSGSDTEDFYRRIVNMATSITYTHPHAFVRMYGRLFRITGISRLLAQYTNLLFSMISEVVVAKTMLLLNVDFRRMKQGLFLYSFLPINLCMSVILLRESVVSMFITLGVYFFLRWITKNKGILDLVLSFASILLGSLFHSGSIAVAAGEICVLMLYDRKRQMFSFKTSNILFAAFFIFIFVFLYNNYSNLLFAKFADIDSIEDIAGGRVHGKSSYAAYVGDSRTPFRMLIFTIPRIICFLFTPFPWDFRGMKDVIAFLFSSLFYFIVSVKTIKSIFYMKKQYRRNLLLILLILAFATTFVFGWGTSNSGTALRHREKILSVFILMLSLTESKANKKETIR